MTDCILAALHGGILAFGLILPIGPQNLFVFTSGASNTLRRALIVASAAALSDSLLISIGVLGVSAAALEVPVVRSGMTMFGIGFLIYFGCATWIKHNQDNSVNLADNQQTQINLSRQVMTAFCASLLNPHAILDTVAVIGASSLKYSGATLVSYTLACVGISWVWFLFLTLLGRTVGTFPKVAQASRKLSALAMWICAAFLFASLWK